MNGITNFLLKAGPTRLFAALGVAAVIAAIFFTLVLRMGGEDKALLFSNVDMREAGEITQHLEQANIPYELRGDGTSIFVARSKVLEARMMLSADGLPSPAHNRTCLRAIPPLHRDNANARCHLRALPLPPAHASRSEKNP